uniref:Uncharacterized protein n=1 Tax=Chromera velia CCMP2878 TaxID=1169474 RepID=A0A0G4HJU0_9ALVE|mmetsp:Transcript_32250/g.64010  ORF Transcript_32250/g.64010 Transcript_32250/m.64010 type:complete len:223 (+) Transcript_32250:227-895(+)|eukprot:Cvel_1104.t1-p1 / transcript=Cvel_1104.t1 / gene=Cvel_1104 / organism=Chromera_velia_CCMP2878 / gene_product=hypothetical protein / transcript_product=hypothetical protein / location=Cvel_scaffold36:39070-39735(+) / protein_length=222 / sequence_SO=supercontig / SO=protein_coding / is_pseudo=false
MAGITDPLVAGLSILDLILIVVILILISVIIVLACLLTKIRKEAEMKAINHINDTRRAQETLQLQEKRGSIVSSLQERVFGDPVGTNRPDLYVEGKKDIEPSKVGHQYVPVEFKERAATMQRQQSMKSSHRGNTPTGASAKRSESGSPSRQASFAAGGGGSTPGGSPQRKLERSGTATSSKRGGDFDRNRQSVNSVAQNANRIRRADSRMSRATSGGGDTWV